MTNETFEKTIAKFPKMLDEAIKQERIKRAIRAVIKRAIKAEVNDGTEPDV